MLYKSRWYNKDEEALFQQTVAGFCSFDDDADNGDSFDDDGFDDEGFDDLGGWDDIGLDDSYDDIGGFGGDSTDDIGGWDDLDGRGIDFDTFSTEDFSTYGFNESFDRGYGFDDTGKAYDNAFEAALDGLFGGFTVADVFDGVAKSIGFALGGPIGGALASLAVSIARGESFSQTAVTALANTTGIPGLEMALERTQLGRDVSTAFEDAVSRNTPDEIEAAYSEMSQAFGGTGSFDLGGFNTETGEFDVGDNFGSQFDDADDAFARNVLGAFANRGTDFDFNALQQAELQRRRDALAAQNDPFFKNLLDSFQGNYLDTNIESFLDELQRPAQEEVGFQVARGNLNAFGGKNANQILAEQRASALDFLQPTIENLRGEYTTGISDIEGLADEAARGYEFGGEFDFGPFRAQADDFSTSFGESITPALRDAIGTRTFFDPSEAIQTGAGVQGLTSGPRNSQDLIELLASRGDPRRNNRKVNRGLGFSGKGAF